MKFGWLTLALSPSPDEDAVRIDDQIEQVCAAESLGFDDVWLTEHYFTGESVYNDALLFASALTMRTTRIRIGFAVIQMPFHHPIRLAVQLALLDNLSKGRIDVGIGKGTVYNEYEFVGHGLRSDDSRGRMAEAIEVLERAWRETPLTYQGKYFNLRCRRCDPDPCNNPALRSGAASSRPPHSWSAAASASRSSPRGYRSNASRNGGHSMRRVSRRVAMTGRRVNGYWPRPHSGGTSMSRYPIPRRKTNFRRCCCAPARI